LLTDTTFVAVVFFYDQDQQQSGQEKIFIFLFTAKINELLKVGRFANKLYGKHTHVLTIINMATVRNFYFISGILNVVEIMHKHTSISPKFTSISRLLRLSSPQRLKQRKEIRPQKLCDATQKWVKSNSFSG
jgi:hypothetical protein